MVGSFELSPPSVNIINLRKIEMDTKFQEKQGNLCKQRQLAFQNRIGMDAGKWDV